MNTEHLREFVTLVHRLNFTAAASDLGMSQPTLSRHIAELERYYGAKLIARGDSPSLTYAGELLLDGATELLQQEDALRSQVRDAGSVHICELRIQEWRYSNRAMGVIRRAVSAVAGTNPELRTRFVASEYGKSVPEAVLSGSLDIGILAHTYAGHPTFASYDGVGVLPLRSSRTRLCFYAGPKSPLLGRDSVSIADLRGQTVVVPLVSECANIRGDVTRLCAPYGFVPTFLATTLGSIDDIFCMDLRSALLIGIEEYSLRGLSDGRAHMIRCSDDAWVITYLVHSEAGANPLLGRLIQEISAADAAAVAETEGEAEGASTSR